MKIKIPFLKVIFFIFEIFALPRINASESQAHKEIVIIIGEAHIKYPFHLESHIYIYPSRHSHIVIFRHRIEKCWREKFIILFFIFPSLFAAPNMYVYACVNQNEMIEMMPLYDRINVRSCECVRTAVSHMYNGIQSS